MPKAEKVIRNVAITYSVHALGALLGLPPYLLQGVVHGAMHANINLSAVIAALPGPLADWARPLSDPSDLPLVKAAFSRLGLGVPDWLLPEANLSGFVSHYAAFLGNMTEWQSPDWNISGLASRYRAAVNMSELRWPTAWANTSLPGGNWTSWFPRNFNLSGIWKGFPGNNTKTTDEDGIRPNVIYCRADGDCIWGDEWQSQLNDLADLAKNGTAIYCTANGQCAVGGYKPSLDGFSGRAQVASWIIRGAASFAERFLPRDD